MIDNSILIVFGYHLKRNDRLNLCCFWCFISDKLFGMELNAFSFLLNGLFVGFFIEFKLFCIHGEPL